MDARFITADLEIPLEPVVMTGILPAIFLGFKNNEAYSRWWEARSIWGLGVNYSRAWARQVLTLLSADPDERDELQAMRRRLIRRQIAFIYALRVNPSPSNRSRWKIPKKSQAAMATTTISAGNSSAKKISKPWAGRTTRQTRFCRSRGKTSGRLRSELVQRLPTGAPRPNARRLNHVQGRSERIKKHPLPRPYSYFTRVFVRIHGRCFPLRSASRLGG